MNRDFAEMLSALSAEGAEYLLVGAYALAVHGRPRATGDLDVWIRPSGENARKVMRALREFGAPLAGLSEKDLATPGTVLQIGVAPNRIDLPTAIEGVEFEAAWTTRLRKVVEGVEVPVIGREELLRNKRATGRPRDRLDAEWLESDE